VIRKNLTLIEIDIDVYKLIQAHRQSFGETDNDILRRLLSLPPKERPEPETGRREYAEGMSLRYGVILPNGTLLRCRHKGTEHKAEVNGNTIFLNGKRYTSPSSAAVAITGTSVNGWKFWEVNLHNEEGWILLDKLKKLT